MAKLIISENNFFIKVFLSSKKVLPKSSKKKMKKPTSASSVPSSLPEEEIEFFFAALQSTTISTNNDIEGKLSTPKKVDDPAVAIIKRNKLNDALEAFRMAATNLSTSPELLKTTRLHLMECLSDSGFLDKTFTLFNARMDQLKAEEDARKQSSGKFIFQTKSCYVQTKMQEVVRGLFIGSWHPSNDPELLKSAGVTHLCCCINVKPRLEDKGFKYTVIPAEDNNEYDISQHFEQTFGFIDGALSQGTGVLVYCGAGISRSTTVLAAYLMRKLKIGAQDAVEMIQKKRQVARPNNGFMKQLKEFQNKLGIIVVS